MLASLTMILQEPFYQSYHLFEVQRVAYLGFRVLNEAFTIACPFALPLFICL